MANVQNSREIVVALREHGADVEREVASEMAQLAQLGVRTMQRLVPKGRSTLVKSITAFKRDKFTHDIRPTLGYAEYVDGGVKPGGKGLPRFFDPASASIVDWLRSHPKGGGFAKRTPPRGSKALQVVNLELRDRYHAFAFSVRKRGIKAKPFVEPTAQAMAPEMLKRLDLAVRRVLAAHPVIGGGA